MLTSPDWPGILSGQRWVYQGGGSYGYPPQKIAYANGEIFHCLWQLFHGGYGMRADSPRHFTGFIHPPRQTDGTKT
jgi:hypothetical protein